MQATPLSLPEIKLPSWVRVDRFLGRELVCSFAPMFEGAGTGIMTATLSECLPHTRPGTVRAGSRVEAVKGVEHIECDGSLTASAPSRKAPPREDD